MISIKEAGTENNIALGLSAQAGEILARISEEIDIEEEADRYFEESRTHNETKTEEEKRTREELKAILIPFAREVAIAKGEPIPVDVRYQRAHGEGAYNVPAFVHETPPIPVKRKKYTGLGIVMRTEVEATGPENYEVKRISIQQVAIETGERIVSKGDFYMSVESNFVKNYLTANANSSELGVALYTVSRMQKELPDYAVQPFDVVAEAPSA